MNKNALKYILLFLTGFSWHIYAQKQNTGKQTISAAGIKPAELHHKASLPPPYPEVDSLELALSKRDNKLAKVNTLILLAYAFQKHEILDSCFFYARIADSISAKMAFENNEAIALSIMGDVYSYISKFDSAAKYELKAAEIFKLINNKAAEINPLTTLIEIYQSTAAYDKVLRYALQSLVVAKEINNKSDICTAYGEIGGAYHSLGQFDKALEYDFEAQKLANQIGNKEQIAFVLCGIGDAYGSLANYTKAIEYFQKGLELDEQSGKKDQVATFNLNLSVIYSDMGNYAKAKECELNALTLAKEIGDREIMCRSLGQLGSDCANQHNYSLSQKYYAIALNISLQIGDKDEAAYTYSNLGATYIKLKKYERAKRMLDSAIIISKNVRDNESLVQTYMNIASLDSAMGNYKQSLEDYKLYNIYHDSLLSREKLKKITQLEMTKEFEHEQDSIASVQKKTDMIKEAEQKKRRGITYSIITLLVLLILWVIAMLRRLSVKRKNDKRVFEHEKRHIEQELAKAKAELSNYIKDMLDKTALLEQYRADAEELKTFKARETEEKRIDNLEDLHKTAILTDEDWMKFKDLFEQVYRGFFIRLKEKLPDLTQAEIRFVCLSKLKLDTKQMASILVVSSDTIKKSRYRLRKKLNLSDEDNLDDIIASI